MAFGNGGTLSGSGTVMANQASYGMPGLGKLAEPVESASKIRDGITYVEQQIAELHGLIEVFERRLDTVLAPVPPTVTDGRGNNVSRQPMSHIQDRLATMSECLTSAKLRLGALLDRVEV